MINGLLEYHEIVDCITSALDARDPYTGNHSRRVSDMSCKLCDFLNVNQTQKLEIDIAGHLHDIGKIGVRDSVLLKPGKLDDDEWEQMKKHSKIGADILEKSPYFSRIAAIILHHHERFDGKGYPFGAKSYEIPFGSRIIAVCDSIDAMLSNRSYRNAMTSDACYNEIDKNVDKMYDPEIAGSMLNHWDAVEQMYFK